MRGADPGRRLRRALPRQDEGAPRGRGRPAAGRAPRALHRRGLEGGTDRRPRAEARGSGGASDHQRAPDAGHGGGRPPLQRQPAHRRRGAPVRGGDEGGGGPSRGLHGQGRELRARHHGAGHRQGRRPRHRQEPRRDHPEEQWLPHHQSRDQGAARGPHRRVSPPQAGCVRPLRAPRQVRPADGRDRAGPARGGHRDPALRRAGGADAQVHGDPHRRGVSGADALRQGRDGRARHRQSALQRHHARCAARAGAGRAGGAARRRRRRAGTRRRPRPGWWPRGRRSRATSSCPRRRTSTCTCCAMCR